jgi:hypothetical protein
MFAPSSRPESEGGPECLPVYVIVGAVNLISPVTLKFLERRIHVSEGHIVPLEEFDSLIQREH